MIRPVQFRFNEQTAVNNYYQKNSSDSSRQVQFDALKQFDTFVQKLRDKGVNVIVVNDTPVPSTPDSIFPNNWVSFHQDGRVGLYPMFAENRRQERRQDILETLKSEYSFKLSEVVDFTHFEIHQKYLEGTGSMIFDRPNKLVYAIISERMNEDALAEFCSVFGYNPVVFHAYQSVGDKRLPIYHTNVMMCVANEFVVICLDAIDDEEEQKFVCEAIKKTGKEIIAISEDQTQQFAGNMLQVLGDKEKPYLVMSTAAFNSLKIDQVEKIESYCPIIHSDLHTIEELGGGSARCMMAEVFLPR